MVDGRVVLNQPLRGNHRTTNATPGCPGGRRTTRSGGQDGRTPDPCQQRQHQLHRRQPHRYQVGKADPLRAQRRRNHSDSKHQELTDGGLLAVIGYIVVITAQFLLMPVVISVVVIAGCSYGVLVALTDDDRRIIDQTAPANMAGVSQESPGDVVERLVSALRNRPDHSKLQRVLVAVTETDVLRQTSVGAGLAGSEPDTRAWLADMGWANWSRALDQCSDEVRYFASGLDREPEHLVAAAAWLFGIKVDRSTPAGSGTLRAARMPWVPSGRYGRIPLSYQVGRGLLLICPGLISALTIAATAGLIIMEMLGLYG
jgi:hypothetical protein